LKADPLFSIVIPTYNRAALIGDTLRTVFAQDLRDFEVIVVDDGSTDNTQSVIETFSDERLQYFKRANAERGASRNFGARQARGRYINFFDSDDLMYPKHLSVAKESIAVWSEPEFFHLGYDFKTPDGNVVRVVNNFDKSISNKVLYDNVLSCNGVFVRREIALEQPFDEDRRLASAEDWELWIRLLSRYAFHFSNEVTTSVVSHDQRSIHVIKAGKVITRDLLLIEKLKRDPLVMRRYGSGFNRFRANRYSYFMLSLAEAGSSREVVQWGARALKAYPPIVFTARYLASMKKILIG
jgi:glycosyltransferase involved in cell wall biosynthesis